MIMCVCALQEEDGGRFTQQDNQLLPTLEAKRDETGGIHLVDCNTKNTIEVSV